jgi:Alkylmercury lyase
VSGEGPDAVRAVRRAGFAALLAGRRPTVAELAAAAGVTQDEAASAVRWLVAAGRATTAGDGRLDGVAGVTTRVTRHAVEWSGGRARTWCAFDAVAIPAALRWTARAVTACGSCGAPLRVPLERGAPVGPAWGWLPPGDCEHVLRDFCAVADLFCDRAHLDAWRTGAGDPSGEPHPVAALAELGRSAWADCLPPAAPAAER